MERLITVKDIQMRYGCSMPTARKYLRQIVPHMDNPLAATEWAFKAWEESRTIFPATMSKARRQEITKKTERVIVPRKR